MEQTLISIFEELDSSNNVTVALGLDRLDQLLADICLPSQMNHPSTQTSIQTNEASSGRLHKNKNISILIHDPAYIEIISLQDSFQYNVASKLMTCLSKLTHDTNECEYPAGVDVCLVLIF